MKAPAWARTSDSETLPVTGASDSEVPVPLGAQRIINPSHHDPGASDRPPLADSGLAKKGRRRAARRICPASEQDSKLAGGPGPGRRAAAAASGGPGSLSVVSHASKSGRLQVLATAPVPDHDHDGHALVVLSLRLASDSDSDWDDHDPSHSGARGLDQASASASGPASHGASDCGGAAALRLAGPASSDWHRLGT